MKDRIVRIILMGIMVVIAPFILMYAFALAFGGVLRGEITSL